MTAAPEPAFDLQAVIDEVTHGQRVVDSDPVVREILRRVPPREMPRALAQAVRVVVTASFAHEHDSAANLPDPTPEPTEETTEQKVARLTRLGLSAEQIAERLGVAARTVTRLRNPQHTRPAASRKVAAIREAWRTELLARVDIGERVKALGDCDRFDLKVAADAHDLTARRYRRLAALLEQHDTEHVHDLDDAILEDALRAEVDVR